MKRLTLVGFPDGLVRQDITPTPAHFGKNALFRLTPSLSRSLLILSLGRTIAMLEGKPHQLRSIL
jgi:hypothetical protein